MLFYHASRSLQYRTPFGAQPVDANVTVRFDADSSAKDVTLCYSYGLYDFNYHEEPMAPVATANDTVTYETRLMLPHEPGLVFYWFRFCEAYGEIKYYVMESDTEDGSGKIYHEPPRIAANEDKYPYAWQITVYARDFKTPDYMKGSLIYQIFPDRFARSDDDTAKKGIEYHKKLGQTPDWHENLDDLFQVGCIGLIKAIDNFNTELDVKFSTYAVPMIIGEVRRYLRDNNSIRVSRSVRDLAYRALQAREKLQSRTNREPTVKEIAEELGEKEEAVSQAIEAIVEPMSLYDPVYSDGGDSIYVMDQISDTGSNDEIWL